MSEPIGASINKGYGVFNKDKTLTIDNFESWDAEFRNDVRARGATGAWISLEQYPPVVYRPAFPNKLTVVYDQSATPFADRLEITPAMQESLIAKAVDRHTVILAAYEAHDIALFSHIMSPTCTSQASKQRFLSSPRCAAIAVGVLNSDWLTLYTIIVETHLTARFGTSSIAVSRAKSQAEAEVAKFTQPASVQTPQHFKNFRDVLRKAKMRGALISNEDAVMTLYSSMYNNVARVRMFENNRNGKSMPTSLDLAEQLILKSEMEQELEREVENDGRKLRGGHHPHHNQGAHRVHVNAESRQNQEDGGSITEDTSVFSFQEQYKSDGRQSGENCYEDEAEHLLAFKAGSRLQRDRQKQYTPEQKAKFSRLSSARKEEVRKLQAARDDLDRKIELARNAKPEQAKVGEKVHLPSAAKQQLTMPLGTFGHLARVKPPAIGKKNCYYCLENTHLARDCQNAAAKRRFVIAQATVMLLAEEGEAMDDTHDEADATSYNNFNGVVAEEYYSDEEPYAASGNDRILMNRHVEEVNHVPSSSTDEMQRLSENMRKCVDALLGVVRIVAREPTTAEVNEQCDLINYPDFPVAGRKRINNDDGSEAYEGTVFDTRGLNLYQT